MGTRTPGVDDALRDSLVVKMSDLFPEDKILQKGRSSDSGFEEFWLSSITTP